MDENFSIPSPLRSRVLLKKIGGKSLDRVTGIKTKEANKTCFHLHAMITKKKRLLSSLKESGNLYPVLSQSHSEET